MSEPATTTPALTVDVISDVVCPWCYIGQRQLDEALARWRERHPEAAAPSVTWHPFQLNPAMPAEGMSRPEYLTMKFGSPTGGPGYQRVVDAAAGAGLELHPERIRRQPSTLRAHALMAAAEPGEQQHALAAALFRAYFIDGTDVGDPAALAPIARGVGMSDDRIAAAGDADALAETERIDQDVRDSGVGGVPFFVIGRKFAVSGAQGADALLAAFERAAGAG
ncbi:MAG: DsbA family oxidoreductase [Burkholderiaceae bacterium]